MTQTNDNVKTIRDLYAAFGAGDLPAILGKLAEDVAWEFVQPSTPIPWLAARRGRDGAQQFFASLAEHLDIRDFQVHAVMADGPWVVGLVSVDAIVRKTGKRLHEQYEAHVWKFDDAGRITAMRHCADTHMQLEAYRG